MSSANKIARILNHPLMALQQTTLSEDWQKFVPRHDRASRTWEQVDSKDWLGVMVMISWIVYDALNDSIGMSWRLVGVLQDFYGFWVLWGVIS
jgi:hypothetical protein